MDLFADLPEPTNEQKVSPEEKTNNDTNTTDVGFEKEAKRKTAEMESICTIKKKQKIEVLYQLRGYYAERKGEREEMQDSHTIISDLTEHIKQEMNSDDQLSEDIKRISYFAVFDGHGGARASKYAAKYLHLNLAKLLPTSSLLKLETEIKKCLIDAFKKTDEDFLKVAAANKPSWKDGTTAVVVLVINNTLFIANLGDSKAILCRQNSDQSDKSEYKPIALSIDHSPTNYEERQRIQKSGGNVKDGRVLGVLEVSRSIGDGQFKKHGVICRPDVKKCELTRNDKYLLIACDGLWKSFTSGDAIQYINNVLDSQEVRGDDAVESACTKVCVEAVKRCSGDNVTVVIVDITRPDHTTSNNT